jgi:hypothetical protein
MIVPESDDERADRLRRMAEHADEVLSITAGQLETIRRAMRPTRCTRGYPDAEAVA